ncbi:FAD-dependent monooxygenase [Dactylosporangium vinaceum]|uniref:FAD-dependent oxidoreductase n=1 Tax=Dactylosporangium vinaceum TaxID=53362 RepID=A0ABV5MDW2_9ACTN|nr:NAD(P)/FAD-dependent oxidoreductase [Dactylosporangium vinaceum]UAC01027.1 FAD-dependent monooxygenase [Dactylosporangium vinaceum]
MAIEVAVAGAGLAGLCLAQRLRRDGVDVHVFERDPGPFGRRQGYRITVDGDGLAALRASLPAHLFERAVAVAGAPGGYFRFTDSRLRDAFKLTFAPTDESGRQMDRQVLRAILLTGLEGRVHYGREAVGVSPDGERVAVRCADGSTVEAALVVAADGVGSALRSSIAPGTEPLDTAAAGIYGRTPLAKADLPAALDKSGVLALGDRPGRAVFFTAMRFGEPQPEGDYVMWGVVVPAGESDRDPAGLVEGFHPLIRRLVDNADPDATVRTRFAVGRRPTAWPLPRATVIGDAIHAMPPFGAHGGNTALRDAALLGGLLTDGRPVEEALADYQQQMVSYAFKAVDTAEAMMRRLTSGGRLAHLVLTRVLPRLHRVTVP